MINRRGMLTGAVAAFAAPMAPAVAGEAAGSRLWRYIAGSEFIVRGTMRPPDNLFAEPRPDIWDIPVEEVTLLKGRPPSPLHLKHASFDSGILDNTGVPSLVGKPAILFLVTGDDGACYLMALDGLMAATPIATAAVESEVGRQKALLAAWRPNPRRPYYGAVKTLIDRVAAIKPSGRADPTAMRTQSSAFQELVALGEPAVPAIIDQMDDRRPLQIPQISLANESPDAFESFRLYGPDLMVDALAAILNQITGEHFGFIYNGASDRQRTTTVEAWRIYLASR